MKNNDFYNIPGEICTKINNWLLKFPVNDKKPAIIYALHLMQKENNYLKSSHIDAVAN